MWYGRLRIQPEVIFGIRAGFKSSLARLTDSHAWTYFDACMHGGPRKKATALLHSSEVCLEQLGLRCKGGHKHFPWGLKATAEERTYPDLLCKRLAKAISDHFASDQLPALLPDMLAKVHTHSQPRRGMQELISEFESVETLYDATPDELDIAARAKMDRKLVTAWKRCYGDCD